MIPGRQKALELLMGARCCNCGPWVEHSMIAAECAEKIAAAAGMDPDRAWVLGLLHDIGRKFGVGHLQHVYDGWRYMTELGYDGAARICLTHSFSTPSLSAYIGNRDIPVEQQAQLEAQLLEIEYDDYDRLIQLCDCLAGSDSVMDMEERMADVKRRYGSYPQKKWDANMALKAYFEQKTGKDIYTVVK